jgi:ligand-binding sensor domain-containing protein
MRLISIYKQTVCSIKIPVKLFLCLFFILNQAIVFSQNPPFINYNEQNGLSTSVVYGLFQDSEDNIWFCTNTGVVKFNGNKLTAYSKKDGLPGNEVFKIFEDSQHRLWFMSANGRISYYKNKKIYNENSHPVFAQVKLNSFISDIREDRDKNIWIVPDKGSIYTLSPDLIAFTEIPVIKTNSIFFSYKDSNYISSRQGIYSLNPQLNKVAFANYDTSTFYARHCFAGKKVYVGRNKKVEIFDMESRKMSTIETPELPDNFNAVVVIDSLLYLCSGNGLSIYNRWNYKKTGQYFSNVNVSHVLKDREGSLWISTLNDGVMYIPNMRVNFLKSVDYFQNNKVLKLGGLGNHVIIGQSNSRAGYYYKGVFKPINSPNESRGEGLTYSIKANVLDSGFFITNQAGVTQFYLHGKISFLKNIAILGFADVDNDSVFISTPSGLDKFSNRLKAAYFSKEASTRFFDNTRAEVLYMNFKDSVLYAGTKNGLLLFKNKKRIPNKFKILDGLSFTDIEKNKLDIFIATTLGDGVFFFNSDTCIQINEKTGLTDNMCSSLFIQNDSTVWITTLHGLNRIICKYIGGEFKIQIKNFYRNDGLPSNYINDMYIYKDSIWLATNTGLAIFNERDLPNYAYSPKIAVDAFKVNGMYKEILPAGTIDLDRKSNNIVIEFNCRTFKNAGSVLYKYKLAGLNSDWVETRNNQVDFTALAPGGYTFEVYAHGLNENWKTNVEQVKFSIKPAFWQTIWFKILATALILFIAIVVIFKQFRKVKNKFTLQEKIINYEKELLELEQQALRLQMNPHFIFNALNSIQHAILTGKQNDAYNSLELFSSLIRGILENSKHKFISLEDEIEILKIYIEIEAKRFSSGFTYEVKIDPEIDIEAIKIPPMLIQPFVENSIWHGLMPKTEGEKKLELSFTGTDNFIICKVEDNGIGRNKAAAMKSKKHATSLGTTLTFNRVANINMLENKAKYAIEIQDKENDGGTVITITIQR